MSDNFGQLRIRDWRQFDTVEIDFHPNATILTGANGTGKTTLLALLAQHFDWSRQFFALPLRDRDGRFNTWLRHDDLGSWIDLGTLTYEDGHRAMLRMPSGDAEAAAISYNVTILGQQIFPGLYLTSHRSNAIYTKIEHIPASFKTPNEMYAELLGELRNRLQGRRSSKTPFATMKESLIAAAVFSEGSSSLAPDPKAREIWFSYQQVLRDLLPDSLGFERLYVRAAEVVVKTRSSEFPIDESSGGISALMDLGWQILLRSFESDSFVVLFDEPENHLHPELQRQILPRLLRAFPNIQFVISTHSPFIVTSVPDSHVYVFEYGMGGRVASRLLDQVNKAAGAEETLQRVLGLETTMPDWAEQLYRQVLDRHANAPISAESFARLRRELELLGIDAAFPDAVTATINAHEDEVR